MLMRCLKPSATDLHEPTFSQKPLMEEGSEPEQIPWQVTGAFGGK